MSAMKKIAVIGATGMLGIPVTVALIDAGFVVTALSRKPDEAKRVAARSYAHCGSGRA